MNFAKPLYVTAALASLTLAACVGASGEVEETGPKFHADALNTNALNTNALNTNALNTNALNTNALMTSQLSDDALNNNSLIMQALEDPNAREVMKYVVSCALPQGSHLHFKIDGKGYNYEGKIGLAPEWGEPGGQCDGQCQQWVSACLLSRLDYLGNEVLISSRGENPALDTTTGERDSWTVDEATYYGNVFHQPQLRYACLPPGATQIPRVCGPSIDDCAVEVLGYCEDLCGGPTADGAYTNCRVPGVEVGDLDRTPVPTSVTYHGSITVFLQP